MPHPSPQTPPTLNRVAARWRPGNRTMQTQKQHRDESLCKQVTLHTNKSDGNEGSDEIPMAVLAAGSATTLQIAPCYITNDKIANTPRQHPLCASPTAPL